MNELIDIITALCEVSSKCPRCYRSQDGANCTKCNEYYAECNCKPLTKDEIINGETIVD